MDLFWALIFVTKFDSFADYTENRDNGVKCCKKSPNPKVQCLKMTHNHPYKCYVTKLLKVCNFKSTSDIKSKFPKTKVPKIQIHSYIVLYSYSLLISTHYFSFWIQYLTFF